MFHADLVYDKKACFQSRVRPDYDRVVNVDEDGTERISYELVDYRKIQESNGSFLNWSLDALLKAGINPDSAIKTGFNSRLDGFNEMSVAAAAVGAKLDEFEKVKNEKAE